MKKPIPTGFIKAFSQTGINICEALGLNELPRSKLRGIWPGEIFKFPIYILAKISFNILIILLFIPISRLRLSPK